MYRFGDFGRFANKSSARFEQKLLKVFKIDLVSCFTIWFSARAPTVHPPDLLGSPSDLKAFHMSLCLLMHSLSLFSKKYFFLFTMKFCTLNRAFKPIKNVLEKINYRFLMTTRRTLLSKSKSECNKTLEEGHYKTSRNKYERERKLQKYTDIKLCIHATFGNYFWYTTSYIS